jgi:threonine synthase
MAYELGEQLGWRFPDWIIYPTGGGTGMVGMWKAFDEMERIGWKAPGTPEDGLGPGRALRADRPRVRAGRRAVRDVAGARTVADGLRVPKAIGDFLVLRAVRESGGTAIAVSDATWCGDARDGRAEGISAAPEGGAALHALKVLLQDGRVPPTTPSWSSTPAAR